MLFRLALVPVWFPARHVDLLSLLSFAWLATGGEGADDRWLAGLLWLVECPLCAADPGVGGGQLCSRAGHGALPCGGRADLLGWHRGQSRAAGLFQVCKLPARQRRRRLRAGSGAGPHRHPAGHQLLHLPADRLSGRDPPRPAGGAQPAGLFAVRAVLPAPDRRPDHAAHRDAAAVRPQRPRLVRPGLGQDGLHDPGAGAGEEGPGRRHAGQRGRSDLRPGRPGPGARAVRGLARGAGLYVPAVFRLLRLFRHGDRHRPAVRHPLPGQLRLAATRRPASSSSGAAGT